MTSQLYKLLCLTEQKIIYGWGSSPPTICPNSQYHEIVAESVKEVKNYNDESIVSENSEGHFETTHIVMEIPSGTPGDVTEHDVSWPMDILLWRTLLTPTNDMIGDTITVAAAPETTVGVLMAPSSISDTTFNVSPTAVDPENMSRGFLITVDDTVNKDVLGRCIAVDSGAGTITTDTAASYAFAAGTPIKISIYVIKDLQIVNTNTIYVGDKGFRGKLVPAGVILRVYYTNNSGTAKTLLWRPEYYNMG